MHRPGNTLLPCITAAVQNPVCLPQSKDKPEERHAAVAQRTPCTQLLQIEPEGHHASLEDDGGSIYLPGVAQIEDVKMKPLNLEHIRLRYCFTDITDILRDRWGSMSWREVSGAMGDLGTFLPLILNMSIVETPDGEIGAVCLVNALFWAGAFNLATGFLWNSPMPVQPMKTIAAVALTDGLTRFEVIGAGVSVGVIVFFLGVTGLVDTINYAMPPAIVHGLQVGLGISMSLKAIDLLTENEIWPDHGPDCISIGALAFVFILFALTYRARSIPAALIVSLVGFAIAFGVAFESGDATFSPAVPVAVVVKGFGWSDIMRGFWKAGFAQLPLTCLNSVVSVCDLNNRKCFAQEPSKHITRRSVATSVAAMNLLGLWFGAMPMCHGAGGLAAQYKFGARSGAALLFLGTLKIFLACALGGSTQGFLDAYPHCILGALLFFAGLSLASAGASQKHKRLVKKDERRPREEPSKISVPNEDERAMTIALATAAATVSLNTGWGCLFGVFFAVFYGGFDHIIADAKTYIAGRDGRRETSLNHTRPLGEERLATAATELAVAHCI